jgi:hypothetical protein
VPARYAKGEISSGFMGSLESYAYSSPQAAASDSAELPAAATSPAEPPEPQPASEAPPDDSVHTTRIFPGAANGEVTLATTH